MWITNEIFLDYLDCKYKAYLKLQGKQESKSDYILLQKELENNYKKKAIQLLFPQRQDFCFGLLTKELINPRYEQIENGFLQTGKTYCFFDLLEKSPDKSALGSFSYVPVTFRKNENLSQKDKLAVTFNSIMLASFQGIMPIYGKIIYGENFRVSKISTAAYQQQVQAITRDLESFQKKENVQFQIQDYCRSCDFCKAKAKETDDLSLLRGMTTKDIIRQHEKGIFTVTQFSYVFRPKKKRKRVKEYTRSYALELKALAIRENKILVYEEPELPFSPVHIYFDIEGNEKNSFHYLIGLIVIENGLEKRYSFWADMQKEEEQIFQNFLTTCLHYHNFILFHYGSYEITFLKKIKKKYAGKYDIQIDKLLAVCVNVLAIMYSVIFFPTYSNELKDIGNYLGFHWTEENASGLQSIVWRTRWEQIHDASWKQILLQYNMEDCLALQKVTTFLYAISNPQESVTSDGNTNILWTKNIKSETTYRFGKPEFFFPELASINKCAYFNYQREKVFLRTKITVRKQTYETMKKIEKTAHIDSAIEIPSPSVCQVCETSQLQRRTRYNKVVYDLTFFPGGVKKWIMKYTTVSVKCKTCKKESIAEEYKVIQSKYGHGLLSYVIYQIIANGISLERIQQNLSDIFDLHLASSTLYGFKTFAANYYKNTYERLYRDIVKGKLIHADETKVNLKKEAGYVWVFTNMEEVIFVYKNSREGAFLEDFLQDFTGVLVTDYYTAYDFLACKQQKCLIHLIRDLNHDLFLNQLDEELKELGKLFTALLQEIIHTIDTYGLKKRHLQKHKKDVDNFFRYLSKKNFFSTVAESYKKRFEKNKEKLFTFLDYNGVPWNNNNAEHAFKHFATYRKVSNGIFTQYGIEQYLILLSIYQTCQYKNINFLQFLLSKKKNL